jgi:hypothetical protein
MPGSGRAILPNPYICVVIGLRYIYQAGRKSVANCPKVLYSSAMQVHSNRWGKVITTNVSTHGRKGFPFAPGLFLIATGVVVMLAPRLILGAIASIFILIGILGCYVAWKISQFKKKLQEMAQQVEVQYHSETARTHHPDVELSESEYKKIVFH